MHGGAFSAVIPFMATTHMCAAAQIFLNTSKVIDELSLVAVANTAITSIILRAKLYIYTMTELKGMAELRIQSHFVM